MSVRNLGLKCLAFVGLLFSVNVFGSEGEAQARLLLNQAESALKDRNLDGFFASLYQLVESSGSSNYGLLKCVLGRLDNIDGVRQLIADKKQEMKDLKANLTAQKDTPLFGLSGAARGQLGAKLASTDYPKYLRTLQALAAVDLSALREVKANLDAIVRIYGSATSFGNAAFNSNVQLKDNVLNFISKLEEIARASS